MDPYELHEKIIAEYQQGNAPFSHQLDVMQQTLSLQAWVQWVFLISQRYIKEMNFDNFYLSCYTINQNKVIFK